MKFIAGLLVVVASCAAQAGDSVFSDPVGQIPPTHNAAGFPSANPNVDPRQGFASPPLGYGEIPYWWWTGDPLDRERLLWQLDKLQAMGCPGVQINYAHDPSMTTYPVDPPIFSEAWWDTFAWMAGECKKRNMGIGMSGYTLDWPGRDNLFRKIGITDGSLSGASLAMEKREAKAGEYLVWPLPDQTDSIMAYQRDGDTLKPGPGRDLWEFEH